jgi:plasmid maintenance system antidote protein VapI
MGMTETYLEKQIRTAIKKSGNSVYRLAKDSGVPQAALCRFVNGKRGITLATASKLVKTLGLRLIKSQRIQKR